MLKERGTFGTENIVGVLGDTHGETAWTLQALDKFAELGVTHILQLGDFGIWTIFPEFMPQVNERLREHGQILAVTLGNHEDYVLLETARESPDFPGWRVLGDETSILIAPRPHSFEWAGRTILSVGGGNSIDRFHRTPYVSWWPQEQITFAQVRESRNLGKHSLMVTHDCPTGVPLFDGRKTGPDVERIFGRAGTEYAGESREALRAITDAVQPELLLHGHFHFLSDHTVRLQSDDGEYTMRAVGLDRDGSADALRILDLETLKLLSLD